MFGQGISREGDILDLGVKVGAVAKSGSWYSYEGEKIGQGRENAKIFLKEHPDIMQDVENKVRAFYGLPADVLSDELPEEENQTQAGRTASADTSGKTAGTPADKAE